ncbi:MAG TPA: hypothetical protein VJT73_09150 [Polyangiaceae bacterium]|nr:hypothetical protein [Polyangiaceae bacterium]
MPEPPRAPPTIRIARPYGSEKEFVEGDLAWLGRTTIILPNAPARAAGDLIRFEIILGNGAPVFRGEGHIVAHHAPGGTKPPGLEVRFTRVDARSKLILDRVRELRAPATPSLAPPVGPAPISVSISPPISILPPVSISPPVVVQPSRPAAPIERPSGVQVARAHARVAPPPNREEILERLRLRAQKLAKEGGLSFKKRQDAG